MAMTSQRIAAWRILRDGWWTFLVELQNGLDVEPFQQHADAGELSNLRSHLAVFLHNLQRARTPAERAHIVGEARIFLAERDAAYEHQAAIAGLKGNGLPIRHSVEPLTFERQVSNRIAKAAATLSEH